MRGLGLRTSDFGLSDFGLRVSDFGQHTAAAPNSRASFQPRREQVGGHHAHALQGEQAGEHQADRPLPGHQHRVAAQQGEPFDGLEDGVDRFEHRAFEKGVARRDSDHARQDEGHDADVFGIAAARRLEARRDAGALVLGALREGVVPAGMTLQARHVMMQRHALADLELPDARADADDGAGGFVAEDARRRHGAVLDLLDVGRADAADGHPDEQFVRPDARHGHGFEPQIVRPAIHHRLHGLRNQRTCEPIEPQRTRISQNKARRPLAVRSALTVIRARPEAKQLKLSNPGRQLGVKDRLPAAPLEAHLARVQRVVRQDQPPPLLRRQTVLHQRQIQILVASIQLVAHDRMPDVRQVNPDLVLAPRLRPHEQEGEGQSGAG